MHGNRPEHPAVFSARMQHHKDQKKQDQGQKVKPKPDDQATQKRRATFQRKATDAAKAEEAKPKRGVLTHLLPDQ